MNQKVEHCFPMKNALILYKQPDDGRTARSGPTIEIPADAFIDLKPIPTAFVDKKFREYLKQVERDIAARLGIPADLFWEAPDR